MKITKTILLTILLVIITGCAAAKLDTGMGGALTIQSYGVNGATVQYANEYNPNGYSYYMYTWEELKENYPMLSKEIDDLRQKALMEGKK